MKPRPHEVESIAEPSTDKKDGYDEVMDALGSAFMPEGVRFVSADEQTASAQDFALELKKLGLRGPQELKAIKELLGLFLTPEPPEEILENWMNMVANILLEDRPLQVIYEIQKRALETATNLRAVKFARNLFYEDCADSTLQMANGSNDFPIPDNLWPTFTEAKLVKQLDEDLFKQLGPESDTALAPPGRVELEHIELSQFVDNITKLGIMLYKHFGEEALVLASALVIFASRYSPHNNLVEQAKKEGGAENSRAIMDYAVETHEFPENRIPYAIWWALGGRYIAELFKNETDGGDIFKCLDYLAADPTGNVPVILESVKNRIIADENFREHLINAVWRLIRAPERLMIHAFVRLGMGTLIQADEVTSHKWWKRRAEELVLLERDYDQKRDPKGELRAWLDIQRTDIREKLERYPESSEPARKLTQVIGCEKLCRELDEVREEHNATGLRMKTREIISRIVAAVSRYQIIHRKEGENISPWKLGFPTNVVTDQFVSCFSGPWLIASLLIKCGIPYEDILYCHTYQSRDGLMGAHGSLIIRAAPDDLVFVDLNSRPELADVPVDLIHTKVKESILKLFNGDKKTETVVCAPDSASISTGMSKRFAVMPLINGLTSGHLLHVGLSFLHEDRLNEAEKALKIASCDFHYDPDVWYYLGAISLKRGDESKAKACLKAGLNSFWEHPQCHYALGILYAQEGNIFGAKMHFSFVAQQSGLIYLGQRLADYAQKFIDTPTDTLLRGLRTSKPPKNFDLTRAA